MNNNSITFKNVCKSYRDVLVVKDMTLEIKSGERLILLGPSGCGKSTILRMIAGLEETSTGEIFFGDKLANHTEAADRNIAMVFQNYALYPHMNVWNNITFGLRMNKVSKEEIEQRTREAIKILNLEGLEKRYPKELSGGQRQRVALCRSIVKQSPFFLLDEPLSNLDVHLRTKSREELVKLHNLYRPTFIYVTHDQIEAMTVGHRIAVLNKGSLQQVDTPEVIYDKPANIFVAKFIGIPQINILRVRVESEDIFFQYQKISVCMEKKILLQEKREVYLGLRPEYVSVSHEKKEESIRGVISKIENYGSQKCLLIDVGEEQIILASVSNDSGFNRYEEVFVSFSKKNMIFFDINTEKILES